MIDRLVVENIQSHEKSELDFSPGINCIVGSSDNGKTALLRAMFWCIRNRPLGSDILVSHWAKNEKGKINKTVSVSISNEKGTVIRKKTSTDNNYLIQLNKEDIKLLEVIRTDVPEEIEKFFNLSETNIQQQQDAPFLLSASAADVARFFNRIVRLDIIDKVLSNAENQRRKNKQENDLYNKSLEQLKMQEEKWNWIETAEPILEKVERVKNRIEKYKDTQTRILEEIEIIKDLEKNRVDPSLLSLALDKITAIKKHEANIKAFEGDWDTLNRSVKEYKRNENIITKTKPCKKAKKYIEALADIKNKSDPLYTKFNRLNSSIVNYSHTLNEKKEAEKEIEKYRELLPEVCPLCGGGLNR